MRNQLSLSIKQGISITPQLQRAIQLLQLSTLELQEFIQEESCENPFLELEAANQANFVTKQAFENYSRANISNNSTTLNKDFENIYHTQTDLKEHLIWQIDLMPMTMQDRIIAEYIIEALDDNGILTTSFAEIVSSITAFYPDIGEQECLVVLHIINHLDPIGCGASNTIESLKIQLHTIDAKKNIKKLANAILDKHLSLLAQNNLAKISRALKSSMASTTNAVNILQSLSPNPGAVFCNSTTIYVEPDVIATKQGKKWIAQLNPRYTPRIKLDKQYLEMLKESATLAKDSFANEKMQAATWLKRSLKVRNSTLLQVANFLLRYQQDFFCHGNISLKPLTLSIIATELGLHESTVSRITMNKYIQTPHGTMQLKQLFSSHVALSNGGQISSKAVQATLKKVINDEPPYAPYSDAKLQAILSQQGIKISRRTVAKYRELADIPTSARRKLLESTT